VAGGHHGGAWKVAYADFVTAMMAFFLLMWLLGATTEKQRKGIADYFAPTLMKMRQGAGGGTGLLGGSSLTDVTNIRIARGRRAPRR
jgi:chemotaxis protein MotB